MTAAGIVIIGRNEGERLARCIQSVLASGARNLVYVDSGSTDQSVWVARSLGAEVIRLDPRIPFSAARARNEGFAALLQANPELQVVQFIDGDCELQPGWLAAAGRFLAEHPEAAVVCGRRRERFPDASVYNWLCDVEWDAKVGEIEWCGGDFLVRPKVFATVRGFDESFVAGEEPELCRRISATGQTLWRLQLPMTIHDAAITAFSAWWRRSVRTGFAWATTAWTYRQQAVIPGAREQRRAWLWTMILPCTAAGAILISPWFLTLLSAYILQLLRIAWRSRRCGARRAVLLATFTCIAYFAQSQGSLRFHVSRLMRRRPMVIEYKSAASAEVV